MIYDADTRARAHKRESESRVKNRPSTAGSFALSTPRKRREIKRDLSLSLSSLFLSFSHAQFSVTVANASANSRRGENASRLVSTRAKAPRRLKIAKSGAVRTRVAPRLINCAATDVRLIGISCSQLVSFALNASQVRAVHAHSSRDFLREKCGMRITQARAVYVSAAIIREKKINRLVARETIFRDRPPCGRPYYRCSKPVLRAQARADLTRCCVLRTRNTLLTYFSWLKVNVCDSVT